MYVYNMRQGRFEDINLERLSMLYMYVIGRLVSHTDASIISIYSVLGWYQWRHPPNKYILLSAIKQEE